MSLNFLDVTFKATHRHHTGGLIQVIGTTDLLLGPTAVSCVVYWNIARVIMVEPIDRFITLLPDGRPKFMPMHPRWDAAAFLKAPGAPLAGFVQDFDKAERKIEPLQ